MSTINRIVMYQTTHPKEAAGALEKTRDLTGLPIHPEF